MFIDEAKICTVGGKGGNGCISFRQQGRNRFKRRPTGGNGGWGGDVVLQATARMRTLFTFTKQIHWKAEPGAHGGPNGRTGKRGKVSVIKVPVGTVIKDLRSQEVLADMTTPGQRLTVARGGLGGRGNESFLSNRFKSPRICEVGDWGEEQWLKLELKTLADVGLIGFPNAGKSTLLSAISQAKPKVGAYPFTTLEPHIGIVSRDYQDFAAVDIPGLISGAHDGRGLGDRFLKHVERTRLLVHVVDLSGWEGRDPLEDYRVINQELRAFAPELGQRPQIVVGNKTDLMDENDVKAQLERFRRELNVELLPVSAATRAGTETVVGRCFAWLDSQTAPERAGSDDDEPTQRVYTFEEEAPWRIVEDEEGFLIQGPRVKRLGLLRLESDDALVYLHEQLEHLGVLAALEEQGVEPGDVVRMGRLEFEYAEPHAPSG